MNSKRLLGLVLTLVLTTTLLGGCVRPMPTPTLIIHPKPNLNINQAIYEMLGCKPDSACATKGTELAALGCEHLLPPDSLLGGLSPSYPIAQCVWTLETKPAGLFSTSCGKGYSFGLAVLRDGQYQLAASVADLRALYAPIESEDEALSFAILGTGFDPAYYEGLRPEGKAGYPGLVFLTEQLEDTHVTKSEDVYTVRLYDTEGCGCSSHPTSAQDVLVTADGQISISSQGRVFELETVICWD